MVRYTGKEPIYYVVALAVGVVAVVGLDVDRGYGLEFVVEGYTYL